MNVFENIYNQAKLDVERNKKYEKKYGKVVKWEPVNKIGRNSLCPCGSGKKYKKCCLKIKMLSK